MKPQLMTRQAEQSAMAISGELVPAAGHSARRRSQRNVAHSDEGADEQGCWHVDFGVMPTARRRGGRLTSVRRWFGRMFQRSRSVGVFGAGRDGDVAACAAFLMGLFSASVVLVLAVARDAGWGALLGDTALTFSLTTTGAFVFGLIAIKGLGLMGVSLADFDPK